jgi:hypothetical protein
MIVIQMETSKRSFDSQCALTDLRAETPAIFGPGMILLIRHAQSLPLFSKLGYLDMTDLTR